MVVRMELYKIAEELSEMLINSDIYKRFVEAKQRLEEHEDILNRVKEYRCKNFNIQNGVSDNKKEQIVNLENEYQDILRNTVARDFLNAELVLCKTIKNIQEIIVNKIDLNMDFLQ